MSFSLKTVLLGMLVASLFVAVGCGGSDKKSSSTPGGDSREELAQKAALICQTDSSSADKLADNPSKSDRDEVVKELTQSEDQAAVVANDAGKLESSADRDSIRTATRHGGKSAHELEAVARDPNDLEAAGAARAEFAACVTALKAVERAVDVSGLMEGLSSKGFDSLVAGGSRTTTTTTTTTETQTTTTGPGPNGGETSDLPLCSDSPPPCRTAGGGVEAP